MRNIVLTILIFTCLCLYSQNEGDKYRREGDLEKAIQAYTEVFDKDPANSNNTYNLACAYALLHQIDKAYHYLDKALKNDNTLWVLADNDLLSLRDDMRWKNIEVNQFNKYQKNKGKLKKPELAKQLLRLIGEDQMFDYHMDLAKQFFVKNGRAPHWYYPLGYVKKQKAEENFRKLEELIEKFGWPTYSDVGKLAADGPLLIINHHEKEEIRLKYLPLIKETCEKQEGSCVEYAKIKDRVLVNTGKKQLYGMQFAYNAENKLEPLPIFEPEFVDQRREKIGLPSLKEYLKRKINYDFKVAQKKK
ncbi:tetratricopeptide repeat protein [uncultured Tenacibaculum sp.]|uniref:tetratricopeptide repeat protein n=1 Tax=uncultured Tenacibaculum sp. TaxID=174713 RepID=UPI00262E813D|nr:tetratricopeptide repeat protein [uncultured Tenacibaculum sp.]